MTVSRFVKVFNTICKYHSADGCNFCPLGNKSKGEICTEFVYKHPKLAQRLVKAEYDSIKGKEEK